MKNIEKLISIYFYICDCHDRDLSLHFQRISNNFNPPLSDQEVLTIFFYCLIVEKRTQIKDIYEFADNYLRPWFPDLGTTYESFLVRLNNLHELFPQIAFLLIEHKMARINPEQIKVWKDLFFSVVDSMPIIVAKGARSFSASVAADICDKGYCSSKKLHYYGLKLHVLGFSRFDLLPLPEFMATSPASNNDLTVFKPIFETLFNRAVFADKLYSTAVSRFRQPIEAFFNWIIEKTAIQNASKVRSTKGLLTHVFGRFAAALMIMTLDFL
jgi:hypothetical protein